MADLTETETYNLVESFKALGARSKCDSPEELKQWITGYAAAQGMMNVKSEAVKPDDHKDDIGTSRTNILSAMKETYRDSMKDAALNTAIEALTLQQRSIHENNGILAQLTTTQDMHLPRGAEILSIVQF